MPELPEVETVRRFLSTKLIGKTFDDVRIFYKPVLKNNPKDLANSLKNKSILELDRRGKFLIFKLDDNSHLVFHLRMEGKLFYYDDLDSLDKHTTVLFTFKDKSILAFIDVRKFGCVWYYERNQNIECILNLGPEANNLTGEQVKLAFKDEKRPLKEVLLDQNKIAGIGNIYADEICFAIKRNPFICLNQSIDSTIFDKIAKSSNDILNKAILNKGSTIKSFLSSQGEEGDNQKCLKVYGRNGSPCIDCGFKIQKRELKGRGTSYCPKCQSVPLVIGVTGGMASGKSTFSKWLSEYLDSIYVDCDIFVKEMYKDKVFSRDLFIRFPYLFDKHNRIDKSKVTIMLTSNKKQRNLYLSFVYRELKNRLISLINSNPNKSFVIEAPLLFQARLDSICYPIIMMETNDIKGHLISRGETNIEDRLKLADTNNWKRYESFCDYIIHSNSSLGDLKIKAKDLVTNNIKI